MFIFVMYKDAPELSNYLRRTMSSTDLDPATEKTLLVNPYCPVRIMLEYIRKKCKLGIFAKFDLADRSGALKGLFNLPTYVYATDRFEHKKTYYLIVIKQEVDKSTSILPQISHENPLYETLQERVRRFLLTGDVSPATTTPPQPSSTAIKSKAKKK